MKNGDRPAHPIISAEGGCTNIENLNSRVELSGLTKREHFAGIAMQGLISAWPDHMGSMSSENVANHAISYADELLKKLES